MNEGLGGHAGPHARPDHRSTASPCGGDDDQGHRRHHHHDGALFGTAPNPDGELQKAVEALIGKKLSITWVPDAELQRQGERDAGVQQPAGRDGHRREIPSFVKTAEAGAFWDLTGKLDKYPNLKPPTRRPPRTR